MLLTAVALDVGLSSCQADDFYKPGNGHIFEAMRSLRERGEPVDPVTVADELRRAGLLDAVGGAATLITLQANTPATTNAGRYASIITELAVLRRVIGVTAELAEQAYSVPRDVDGLIAAASARLATAGRRSAIPQGGPVDLATFLASGEVEYDWLVPGLLERGDRLIVTGGEGCGKSTLLHQVAIQIGAGLHPFIWSPVQPARVLLLDLENGERHVRRKLRELREVLDKPTVDEMVYVECLVGLDLLNATDVSHLQRLVAEVGPDLLITGPLYKMAGGDPTAEESARIVAGVLDRIRADHRCAVILEAHTPHGAEERPYGASLWKRWPEFGLFLAPDGQLRHWRGQRDEREWPSALKRSSPWPWEPASARAEAPAWNGPTRCKEAISALLSHQPGVEMSINEIADQLREKCTPFRKQTVSAAASQLANDGVIHLRNGPRGSRLFTFMEVKQDEIF